MLLWQYNRDYNRFLLRSLGKTVFESSSAGWRRVPQTGRKRESGGGGVWTEVGTWLREDILRGNSGAKKGVMTLCKTSPMEKKCTWERPPYPG